jgi:hypothetical protein
MLVPVVVRTVEIAAVGFADVFLSQPKPPGYVIALLAE